MTSVDVAAQQKRINELALQDVDSLAEQQRQCAAELKALPDAIKEAAKAAEYKEAARLQERVDLLNRSATELAAARAMCRWIFYYGEEVCISKLIYGASHGLATMADSAGWTPGCARDAERNHEVNVHGCGA